MEERPSANGGGQISGAPHGPDFGASRVGRVSAARTGRPYVSRGQRSSTTARHSPGWPECRPSGRDAEGRAYRAGRGRQPVTRPDHRLVGEVAEARAEPANDQVTIRAGRSVRPVPPEKRVSPLSSPPPPGSRQTDPGRVAGRMAHREGVCTNTQHHCVAEASADAWCHRVDALASRGGDAGRFDGVGVDRRPCHSLDPPHRAEMVPIGMRGSPPTAARGRRVRQASALPRPRGRSGPRTRPPGPRGDRSWCANPEVQQAVLAAIHDK